MRVLVVEDDDSVRQALRRALMLGGYEVLLAEGGEEGLMRAASDVPDVIVLDVGLPDIDGLAVCRALRQGGNRTPILMLTAREAVPDRIEGLDAGADDYVTKPYDVGERQASLRRRIAAAVALAVAAVAAAMGVIGYLSVRSHMRGEIDRALQARAQPFLFPHDSSRGGSPPPGDGGRAPGRFAPERGRDGRLPPPAPGPGAGTARGPTRGKAARNRRRGTGAGAAAVWRRVGVLSVRPLRRDGQRPGGHAAATGRCPHPARRPERPWSLPDRRDGARHAPARADRRRPLRPHRGPGGPPPERGRPRAPRLAAHVRSAGGRRDPAGRRPGGPGGPRRLGPDQALRGAHREGLRGP